MTLQIQTEILIDASPTKIWEVLLNFEAYPNWNPFIKSIKGTPSIGNSIHVNLPDMTFQPTITHLEPATKLQWLGKLWFKGLFDGAHSFQLITHKNGTTTFLHSETFSGILVGLFKNQLLSKTKQGFEAMNKALKKTVEGK